MKILIFYLFLTSPLTFAHSSVKCTFENVNGVKYCVIVSRSNYSTTFNEAAKWCRDKLDGTLAMYDPASMQFSTLLLPNAPFHWIGLRRKSTEKNWTWLDGNLLDNEEAMWNEKPVMYNESYGNIDLCAASHVKLSNLTWFQFDCNDAHHNWVCQRPRRNNCHVFTVKHPCRWIDDNCCVSVVEIVTIDGDDGSKCNPSLANVSYSQCGKSACETCMFSGWSQWSMWSCSPNYAEQFFNEKFRYRNITKQAVPAISCRGYSLQQRKMCDENETMNLCDVFKRASTPSLLVTVDENIKMIMLIVFLLSVSFGLLTLFVGCCLYFMDRFAPEVAPPVRNVAKGDVSIKLNPQQSARKKEDTSAMSESRSKSKRS